MERSTDDNPSRSERLRASGEQPLQNPQFQSESKHPGPSTQNLSFTAYGTGDQFNAPEGKLNITKGPGIQFAGATFHGPVTTDRDCLRDLRVTDPRDDKRRIETVNGGLLRDTYSWILAHKDFQQWRDGEQGRLLWIEGGPGMGKTMLLVGIVDELEKLTPDIGILSFFFCQETDWRINNATAVLRGLIYLLVAQQPSLISHILERYEVAGRSLFEDANAFVALSRIFQDMLQDPILAAAYLVIDALDECRTDLPQLLNLITNVSRISSSRVKWIVSSRRSGEIEEHFRRLNDTLIRITLERNEAFTSHAVAVYIDHAISTLPPLQRDDHLRHVVRDRLHQTANGSFLWVALVIRELRHTPPWKVLAVLHRIPAGLEAVFDRALDQIHGDDMEYCRPVISTVAIAYRPLHLLELMVLAGLGQEFQDMDHMRSLVNVCSSFLMIRHDYVYLFHQSVKDYLMTNRVIFPQGGPTHDHHRMFLQSLSALSRTLRKDIYDLHRPGILAEEVKRNDSDPLAPLGYSCLFWASHLVEPSRISLATHGSSDGETVFMFLKRHFLHWLEGLSLLHSIPEGTSSIRLLLQYFESAERPASQLIQFLRDAERFVLSYGSIIQRAPLQTYGSALLFSPARTEVKLQFWNQRLHLIKSITGINENWNACQQTLEGHNGSVWAVAYSPDGRRLASASNDKTILVWNTNTGVCQQRLEGHTGTAKAIAFSPDGRQLASASYDKTIRVWDLNTRQCLQTLEGHSNWVRSVAFSPNCHQLASGSNDKTIRIWSANEGACLQILYGHNNWVSSVAFSFDNRQLASASYDRTVRLWDAATGACQRIIDCFTSIVNSVVFSPDCRRLASASDDKIIRVLDPNTGQCLQSLQSHSHWSSSVAFSPDSHLLASASNDKTIRIWNAESGACHQILKGHSNSISSIAFSPDGRQLASGSSDRTVRLWNTSVEAHERTLEGHEDSVRVLALSPDGRRLASASNDKMVRLWDARTGSCEHTLKGHDAAVMTMAFSPDGLRLASASVDMVIRLWDTNTGEHVLVLKSLNRPVTALAFSSDGLRLASASGEDSVQLWDAINGACKRTIKIGMAITKLYFAADGQYLQTDKGLLLFNADHPFIIIPYQEQSPREILVKKDWVSLNAENILWLPRDYRATCWTSHDDLLVVGHDSGQVTFLELNSSLRNDGAS
ncbi:Vegetative incompatibility protein HET-E-1 [Fusarium oxysporum]|nr:Vegetative incompatibility protein HET-E-1 [Fusarium oxysporum]